MCADVGRQELQSSGQYLRGMRVKIFVIFLLASSCAAAQAQTHQERKVRRLLAKGKAYPAIRIASGVLGKNTHPEFYALRAEGYNSISESGVGCWCWCWKKRRRLRRMLGRGCCVGCWLLVLVLVLVLERAAATSERSP